MGESRGWLRVDLTKVHAVTKKRTLTLLLLMTILSVESTGGDILIMFASERVMAEGFEPRTVIAKMPK